MEENDGFNLIDVSSENNSLIAPDASSSTLAAHQSPDDMVAYKGDNLNLTNGDFEQLPPLLETSEPESIKKTGKCNLRKSLAWDSAFFESPGVLDAEELSSMIEGAEKGKKHLLPEIEEETSRSTESISTLVSENLSLDSLEAELFQDIRASIQKSSKASNTRISNCNWATAETENQANRSMKKVDFISRNKMMPTVASKKQSIGTQGSRRTIKQGSGYLPVTQPALRNGKSTSSLTQSPMVGSAEVIITKRAPLDVKVETYNSKVGGKGNQAPKTTSMPCPRRIVPKPTLSSRSSCSSSGSNKEEAAMSSLCDGPNITVSEKIRKSSSASARRKTDSKHVIQPSSGSIPKTSSKVPLQKKPSGSTSSASCKISSSKSPASSISEWSSASSSTSTVNQRHKSRVSINSSSSGRSLTSDAPVQSNDQISDGIVNQVEGLPSQDMKRSSIQTGVLSRSALVKPSGLRMPSPKIGFFDGAKSVVHTPNGCRQSQSRLPAGLPRIGAGPCSPVGSSTKSGDKKVTPGKKASAGTNTALGNSKTESPKLFKEEDFPNEEPDKNDQDKVSATEQRVLSDDINSKKSGHRKLTPEKKETAGANAAPDNPKSASPKHFQEKDVADGISDKNERDKVCAPEQRVLTDSINWQSEFIDSNCGDVLELSSRKELPEQKGATDLLSSTRTPLVAKDSLCNIEDINIFVGSEVTEKTNLS